MRTFETETRNTLDLSVIPIIKGKTHLPIIIDPSHATGDWKLVGRIVSSDRRRSRRTIIEVHDNPECALSGAQCLKPKIQAAGRQGERSPMSWAATSKKAHRYLAVSARAMRSL
ncbi:MAG: hypothetical protein ACLVJX_08415 [Merdibacter sp.]